MDERNGREEEMRKERLKAILLLELHLSSKAELVLVVMGLKPAADIFFYKKRKSSPEIFEKTLKDFEKALQDAGLAFVEKKDENMHRSIYAVAQTKENAQRLSVLNERRLTDIARSPADDAEFGKLMGYPQSAIDGLLSKQSATEEEIPEDPDIVIGEFILSRDHWQEEREFQRKWNHAIKQYAPDLYAELQEQRATAKTRTVSSKRP